MLHPQNPTLPGNVPNMPTLWHKCFCHCGLLYLFYSSHAAGTTQNDISSWVLSMYVFVWCVYACIHVCEHGYTCVAFRGHLGGWPLTSALRQALFLIHSCVCQANWLESFQTLSCFHIPSQAGCWDHTHTLIITHRFMGVLGIRTQLFTLG